MKKNPYGECHVMHMNMMGIKIRKKRKLSKSVLLASFLPLILVGAVFGSALLPDFNFIATCINVSGGDICSISFE